MRLSFPPLFSETLKIVNKHLLNIVGIALSYIFFTFLIDTYLAYLAKVYATAPNPGLLFIATTIASTLTGALEIIANALMVILVVQRETGVSASLPKIMQYIVSRFFPLLFTLGLVQLVTSIGFVFFIIPGIIFSLAYSQSSIFAIVEGDGALTAMKKSWQLTKRSLIQLFIVYVLYCLVIFIPIFVFILGFSMLKMPEVYLKYVITFVLIMFLNFSLIFGYVVWKTLKLKQTYAPV